MFFARVGFFRDSLDTAWIHTGIVAPSTLPSSLKSFSVQDDVFFFLRIEGPEMEVRLDFIHFKWGSFLDTPSNSREGCLAMGEPPFKLTGSIPPK